MAEGVLLGGEVTGTAAAPISYELLGVGRKLADALGQELTIAVMGDGLGDELANDLISRGADRVLLVNSPIFTKYVLQSDPYVAALEKIIKDRQPNVFLMGRTELGLDVAAQLAFRFDTALPSDCLELSIDPATKQLVAVRGVYGGSARAQFTFEPGKVQMATVKPKTQDAAEPQAGRTGQIERIDPGLDDSVFRTQFVDFREFVQQGVSLEQAEIVVSGGRGIGSAEAYQDTIEVAAAILGGAAGASKASCDAGYSPHTKQVGLTGKRVSPKLYLAVAISGASQHLAGMGTSKCIVAVNKDPDANMFKVARYGVVGDYKQVMPAFIEACRELMAQG
jgi:electron transfer flavoprotein alpha subunit